MATYLLTWNPRRWRWVNLEDCIKQIDEHGLCEMAWSCGVTKKIQSGDRLFLMKLGREPRGIIASGWAGSGVYEGRHWDMWSSATDKKALYVKVYFDTILNPHKRIFRREWLKKGPYRKMCWEPRASGVQIPDDIAERLEKDWAQFLTRGTTFEGNVSVEQVEISETRNEGARTQIWVNSYERNAKARAICIKHHGVSCSVCGFNFERTYGEIGAGFIEIHHIIPLSERGKDYTLNPVTHLRPICCNCHAMIHQRRPPYTIDELKAILGSRKI